MKNLLIVAAAVGLLALTGCDATPADPEETVVFDLPPIDNVVYDANYNVKCFRVQETIRRAWGGCVVSPEPPVGSYEALSFNTYFDDIYVTGGELCFRRQETIRRAWGGCVRVQDLPDPSQFAT